MMRRFRASVTLTLLIVLYEGLLPTLGAADDFPDAFGILLIVAERVHGSRLD